MFVCFVLAQVFTSRYEFVTREQEAALLQDITLQVRTLLVPAGSNTLLTHDDSCKPGSLVPPTVTVWSVCSLQRSWWQCLTPDWHRGLHRVDAGAVQDMP
jgi:hypothetical protein